MKVTNAIIIALVLAHLISFNKNSALSDSHRKPVTKLDNAYSSFEVENAQVKQSQEEDNARTEESSDSPPAPPTADEVAASLMRTQKSELVASIAEELCNNDKYVEKLRGPAGLSPSPKEIARNLMNLIDDEDKALLSTLQQEFWKKHKSSILADPGLIANTAEAVYRTYGKSLQGQKGQDARMPSLEEIARLLSSNFEFAQLVADFKE